MTPAFFIPILECFAEDPTLRQQLADRGRHWVEENFLISRNAAILARAFHEVF
ncbi:MAG: hypothetical protein ACLP0A_04320 [Verrucomicrobiia bacterium]